MKYAIIADIHANLKALQIVLKDIKLQKCSGIVCLGDIVGNNDHPKECLDIIRDMGIPCVKGNQDEYASANDKPTHFRPMAANAIYWTREQLNEEDRKWLRNLPYVREISGFTIVHATLNQPHKWSYVTDKLSAAEHFKHQATPLCFYGHTHRPSVFIHQPAIFSYNSGIREGIYSKFKVEADKKYLVNVGSVGQPRDGTKKLAYAIYDLDENSIELRRLTLPNLSLEIQLKLKNRVLF